MLLNDIGKTPDATFRRINQHLGQNYGFKISEDINDKDLESIMEQIQDEITELKIKGDDSKGSPEISKRLLVLEGIRSLREFAMVQFQSPKLNGVVKNLVDFVVDTFEISGYHGQEDFEKAVGNAMDEYRSSRYRFPDDMIEQRVRLEAMSIIQSAQAIDDASQPADTLGSDHTEMPVHKPEMSGDSPEVPKAISAPVTPGNKELAYEGTKMKEHANLVKNLRYLLETEVSQAEVMMAAKGFAQELQEMVEKIGRLQNEDLPPVTDQMRETYGTDSASAFQTQIYGALQGVMDSLYTAKNQVDDAVDNMANRGQVSAEIDMDKEIGMDDTEMADPTSMDADMDLDNIEADLQSGDDFGGEETLGRSKKTESTDLRNKIHTMRKLVERARKIKEARV